MILIVTKEKLVISASLFHANKEDVICNTMLLPIWEETGLGTPHEVFYTNSSECINNVLKVKVDYKHTELISPIS